MTGDDKFFRRSPILAYLASVTAGSLTTTLCAVVITKLGDYSSSYSETTMSQMFNIMLSVFRMSWLYGFVGALVPFILVLLIAKKRKIGTPFYFASTGMLTSVLLGALFLAVFLPGLLLAGVVSTALSGLVAGITCWRVIRPR
jgi:cytochrome c biogenesis factor